MAYKIFQFDIVTCQVYVTQSCGGKVGVKLMGTLPLLFLLLFAGSLEWKYVVSNKAIDNYI